MSPLRWVLWGLVPGLVAAAPPSAPKSVAGLQFAAPAEAEVTVEVLAPTTKVVAVTWQREVLLLTVYTGKGPKVTKALNVHVEELADRLKKRGDVRDEGLRLHFLGTRRKAHRLSYVREGDAYQATVVAGRRHGRTVVASWTLPTSSRTSAMSVKLIEGLSVLKGAP